LTSGQELGITFMLQQMFVIFTWLAHWHSPINAIRREQKDHLTYRYFCLTKTASHNSKSNHTTVYPSIPSALRPVEHDDSLPNPKPPQQWALCEEKPTSTLPKDEPRPSCSSVDPDFSETTVPHLISQVDLNYLVTDLNLSKIRWNS
jgi:hypothetical protein